MFNFLNKLNWKQFLEDTEETPEKINVSRMVNDFFIFDRIDIKKFMANWQILKCSGSRELIKSESKLLGNINYSTSSIDIFAFPIDRPIAYDNWFIAGYPDVVNWFRDIDEKEVISIMGTSSEEDCFNIEHRFKFEYLRKIVNAFKNKKNKLECS
jgi:hypothetical protein